MNEEEALQAIEQILDMPGTKADRARALFDLGCERRDVVELLEMSYSQAHSIWKRMSNEQDEGEAGRGPDDSNPGQDGDADELERGSRRSGAYGRHSNRRSLRLSPVQVRVATQDGHRVIRVDRDSGPECRQCGRKLNFSIQYLAFVHADSQAEPTDLKDRYPS